MKRAHISWSLCVTGLLSAGLVATGCGRAEEPDTVVPAQAADEARTDVDGQELTVTGCLTANIEGSSYALTPTPAAAGGAMPSAGAPGAGTTFTYELVGNAEDFRRHANTVVTVRGREDVSVAREAELEREAEGEARGAASTDATPTVEVKEEADIKVRRLHASNVLGTGDACPSLGGEEGRATEAPRPQ